MSLNDLDIGLIHPIVYACTPNTEGCNVALRFLHKVLQYFSRYLHLALENADK